MRFLRVARPPLLFAAAAVFAEAWMLARAAHGIPRFAARGGQNCTTMCHGHIPDPGLAARDKRCTLTCIGCHVNPIGGGMRRDGGLFFANFSLPERPREEGSARTGRLTETLSVGMDMRTLLLLPRLDGGPLQATFRGFFFPMQSDLYVRARVHGNVSLLADLYMGAYPSQVTRPREFFALVDDLPFNSWVMAGYFMPPFGLKLDDHTIFTRRDLGFDSLSADAGVAFGLAPGRPYFDLALTNGLPVGEFANYAGAVANPANRRYKALSGHVGYFQEFVQFGLTWQWNAFAPAQPGDPPTVRRMLGAYHTASLGPLTWLWEFDLRETDSPEPLGTPVNPFPLRGSEPERSHDLSAMGEVSLLMWQGLNFSLRGDWRDPLWQGYDPAYRRQYRAMLGAEWYPIPFVELMTYLRVWFASDRYDHTDFLLQAHLFL